MTSPARICRGSPPWAARLDIQFSIALDGLSLWLFALTALLLVVAVLVSWESIKDQQSLYYGLLLLLGTGMLGVFVARDIILFYLFFEFTLVPLFFLIGIWGSEQRRYAAIKFFLFTLAGSVLTLLGLLAIVLWDWNHGGGQAMTFSIPDLTAHLQAIHPMPYRLQVWLFFALFAGFAIKVPLFPLHTWLPLAHTEAPAAGSILLAGVLLKIGTYGFLRFNLPMLPEATAACMPCLLWLAVAGIIYGALVALAQSDLKRLIAYSSVSHLGFCMLGIFALNRVAVQGGALQMINHGLSTGGLFAIVGMIYERYHTRRIADFGGIAAETPVLAFFMVFMTLASIGLPGLNGFVGEFLLLMGMFQRAWGTAATPVDHAVPGHFRAGRQRRRAGGLVHVVAGGPGLLRPLAGAEARRADRRPRPARGPGPGSLVPGHRLDRRAAQVLPRPHGPQPRQADRPGDAGRGQKEDLTPRRQDAKEQEKERIGERKMGERKMNQEKEGKTSGPSSLLSSLKLLSFDSFSFPPYSFPLFFFGLCALRLCVRISSVFSDSPLTIFEVGIGGTYSGSFRNGDCPCPLTSSVS